MRSTPFPAPLALLASATLAGCAATTQLNGDGGRAYEVSVAYIGDRPAVAWYGGTQQHEALFMRYADSAGTPRGPVLQLTDAARDAYEPSLQDIGGEALVAWYEQSAPDREGGARRQVALLARFDAQGRPRWQRQLSAVDANGRIPVVRVRSDTIHVAWIEQRDGSAPMIRVASLDATGRWLQTPRDAGPVGSNTWNLNAAIGADDAFHVLYDSGLASIAKELHWMRVQGDRIDDRRISEDDGKESAYPDIAVDGRHVAITWFDRRDGNAEVYLRCAQLDAAGSPAPDLRVDDAAAQRVTSTPQDSMGAYLTWHDARIELAWSEGAPQRLLLQEFDRDCRPLGNARVLSGTQDDAGIASLAASPAGFALTWDEHSRDSKTPASHGRKPEKSSAVLLRTWP